MYSAKELAIARLIKPDIEVTQLDVTDLAVLQLVRKATGGGSGVYNATITNGIATFGGVVASSPLVSLLLNIPVTQTGSGTPSPTNIRDFVGFSGVTITRNNGVDTGDTYLITFGQTVYSANLDVLTGKLSLTHGIVDLGDLEWNCPPTPTRFYTVDITDISLEADFTDMFCSGYNVISSAVSFSNMPDKSIKRGQSNSYISIRDLDYTDASLFTTAVTGMKLVYKLAEPIEIDLTPTVINTLIGDNVIFADVGDITECKYTRK